MISQLSGRSTAPAFAPTPRSRVMLEKLVVPQLVKNFPEFYGTRNFTSVHTSTQRVSQSWASSIQSNTPNYFLKIYFNIILPSTALSSKWPISLRFPQQTLYACLLSSARAICSVHLTSHFSWLVTRIINVEENKSCSPSLSRPLLPRPS